MLALATCYCNDLYREAERLRIPIERAQVEATAEFPGVGLAATNIRYRAVVRSSASAEAIALLLRETDAVAEVHNTVRAGVPCRVSRSNPETRTTESERRMIVTVFRSRVKPEAREEYARWAGRDERIGTPDARVHFPQRLRG